MGAMENPALDEAYLAVGALFVLIAIAVELPGGIKAMRRSGLCKCLVCIALTCGIVAALVDFLGSMAIALS